MEKHEHVPGPAKTVMATLASVPRMAGIATLAVASVFSGADAQSGKEKQESVGKKEIIDMNSVEGMELLMYKAYVKDPASPEIVLWSQRILKKGPDGIRHLSILPNLPRDRGYAAYCRRLVLQDIRANPEQCAVLLEMFRSGQGDRDALAGMLADVGDAGVGGVHALFTGTYRGPDGKDLTRGEKADGSRCAFHAWGAILAARTTVPDPAKKGETVDQYQHPDDRVAPHLLSVLEKTPSFGDPPSAGEQKELRACAAYLLTMRTSLLPRLHAAMDKNEQISAAAVEGIWRSMAEAERGMFLSLSNPDPVIQAYRPIIEEGRKYPSVKERADLAELRLNFEIDARKERLKKLEK